MRALRGLLGLLLLGMALVPLAFADEDDAAVLVEEANEALEGEEYKAAAVLYRRALEASDTYLPAHFGLGEALMELGDTDEAVVSFRKVVRTAQGRDDMPRAWDRMVTNAKRQLEEHDTRGKELEAAVDETAQALLRLIEKHKASDPDLADRALATLLTLRPDHKRGTEIRERMEAKGARKQAIFDGKQVDDWDGGRSKWWSVEGGAIIGRAKGLATYIRNQETIEGNFDVIMEARITDASGKVPFLALMGAWKAEYNHSRFGILDSAAIWFEYRDEDDKERVFRKPVGSLRGRVDPSAWTTYELRFREDKIHALINGKEVHVIQRASDRDGGYVGILAQDCEAEIRRVDVLHR